MSKQDILDLINEFNFKGNLDMLANYFIKEHIAHLIIAILFVLSAVVLYIIIFKKANEHFVIYDKKSDSIDDLTPLGWVAVGYMAVASICGLFTIHSNIFWIARWSVAPMAALLEIFTIA